ncbi:MAG: ATP-dependent DNA helicase [Thermoanaerobaculum sp.]|nr:ATP-dependent DNA helicase [Thermoanaerobaculum sp.]
MAVRVDLEQKKIWASIQDLLPATSQWGWPGEGVVRLSVGSELHRVVQRRLTQEDPHYAPEVPMSLEFHLSGWSLHADGRCDGLYLTPGQLPVVEEIKTLSFRTDLFRRDFDQARQRFQWQVRLYAYALYPDGNAVARLRLVDLGGEEERVEEVPWSPSQVEAYLRSRLVVFLQQVEERRQQLERWRRSAERLAFPFPTVRPVQREAMEAVEQAVESGRHLLLSAPTGVGKTVAALFPALRQALRQGKRLVFCTAKTLQQKLAVETLVAMNDGSWRSLQIRAKAKMCANQEMVCHEEFCEFLWDLPTKLANSPLLPTLLATAHVDPNTVYSAAQAQLICPFVAQLATLAHALAVVCDYNYVFDPGIALFGRGESGSLNDTILVVDEAHNLVDRARDYYSPRLSRRLVAKALEITGQFGAKVCQELTQTLKQLDEVLKSAVEGALAKEVGTVIADPPLTPLRELRRSLDALMAPYFAFKRQQELWLAADPVVELLLTLARFVEFADTGQPELVSLAERIVPERGEVSCVEENLRLFCLDPAPFLRPLLDSCHACVAMSATLQPFDFYQELLGFDPIRTDTLALPSPFPAEHRLVAVVDTVDTSYRRREHAFAPIAELIPQLVAPGKNALVLFPSYQFLREVTSRLVMDSHLVVIQQSGDSDQLREDMLRQLKDNQQAVVLMGVLGGAFAEGVDYPGEMLSQVIVVSPGLPQVTPERQLLQAYFDQRLGQGFAYAYLIPGMTRVIQAAGRLIRSPQDRGVIVLVCRRFLQRPYVNLLPQEWTGGEPTSLRRQDLPTAIRRFFAQKEPS